MNIDFPLILVLLTLGTGAIWGGYVLWQNVAGKSPAVDDELKAPSVVEISRSFFPVLAVVLVLRSFLVEPFQIPSGSMLPTLEVGDFILVNKFAYGIRLPAIDVKVIDVGHPQRGDIMVFRYPEDGKTNYIKRVVGLPGDTLAYRNKTLYINGTAVDEQFVAAVGSVEILAETLGTVTHRIQETTTTPRRGEGEWVIPDNQYFMMGDNRDNSNDSRFWGFVPDEMIVGKAFAIWMHWQPIFSIPSFRRVGSIDG